jgi:HD-GYP domain-containing protein (c-di-GMP phosphodiesterase class II)
MDKQSFKSILMEKILIALIIMSCLVLLFSVYQRFNYEIDIKADSYSSLSSLFFANLEEEIDEKIEEKKPQYLNEFPAGIKNKLNQVGGMSYYSKVQAEELYLYKLENNEQPVLYKLYLPELIRKVDTKVQLNTEYAVYSSLYEPIIEFDLEAENINFYQRDEIIRHGFNYYYTASNNKPYSRYPFHLIIDLNINILNLLLINLFKIIMYLLITVLITYYLTKEFSERLSTKIIQLAETAYLKGQRAVKGLESDIKLPVTNIKEIDKITSTLKYLFRSNYNYSKELEENHAQIKSTNNALWNVLILTEKLVSNKIEPEVFKEKIEDKTDSLEDETTKPLNNLVTDIITINCEKKEYLNQNQNLIYKTLNLLGEMSEYRDDVTGAHINRVSEIAAILGKEFLETEEELTRLENAAKLHDLGKISIPDKILLKEGKLTDLEYEKMKQHCRAGHNILSRIDDSLFNLAADISLKHHEKWDGTGYPLGLKGADIPLESRIVAICDVFDALKSDRPYKEPYSFKRSFAILEEDKAKHFDPQIVDAFMDNKEKIIQIYQ